MFILHIEGVFPPEIEHVQNMKTNIFYNNNTRYFFIKTTKKEDDLIMANVRNCGNILTSNCQAFQCNALTTLDQVSISGFL